MKGTVPDPYDVIGRLQERNDLLRQELLIATQKPYRGFWRGVVLGGVVVAVLAALPAWSGVCIPASCTATVPEGQEGRVFILEWSGM